MLAFAKVRYEQQRLAAPRPAIFLVRSKLVVHGRPGAFLVGDFLSGDEVRAGMVALIPAGPDVLHPIPICAVEFVDHVADRTSELALQVVGETPDQVAAVEALEGAQLMEVRAPVG
jgi:hypothetical protein